MCVVSNIGDGYRDTFPGRWPNVYPTPQPDPSKFTFNFDNITREEFDALKAEVEELRKLLEAAKEFDKATGQPDCEMDDKVMLIKQLAELVGVDLGDVFGDELS